MEKKEMKTLTDGASRNGNEGPTENEIKEFKKKKALAIFICFAIAILEFFLFGYIVIKNNMLENPAPATTQENNFIILVLFFAIDLWLILEMKVKKTAKKAEGKAQSSDDEKKKLKIALFILIAVSEAAALLYLVIRNDLFSWRPAPLTPREIIVLILAGNFIFGLIFRFINYMKRYRKMIQSQ